jgi:protocatechuate 3,4-dioxygenase beta subunit
MFKASLAALAALTLTLCSTPCHATDANADADQAEARNPTSKSTAERAKRYQRGHARIEGRVFAPDGKPLDDARATASFTAWTFAPCHTDGSFEIGDLVPGKYALMLWHWDYAPVVFGPVHLEADEVLRGVEIKLTPGGVVRGTVRDQQGKPVNTAYVSVSRVDVPKDDLDELAVELLKRPMWEETFGEGEYSSDALSPGKYRIATRLCLRDQVVEVRIGETLEGVDLVVGKGVAVKGRVTDWNGKPITGALVTTRDTLDKVPTRSDGSFELWGLEPGECWIMVEAEGFHRSRIEATAPGENLEIQLAPLPVIRGRALDKVTGEPLKVTHVTANGHLMLDSTLPSDWSADPFEDPPKQTTKRNRESQGTKDIDGRFELTLPESGVCTLLVCADGYAPAKIEAARAVEEHETEELLVEMTKGTTVLFRVVSKQTGLPVEGACIRSLGRDLAEDGRSDSRGRSTIDHLAPGDHLVEISHPEHAKQRVAFQTHEDEPIHQVTVLMDAGFAVDGRVVSARTGEPVAEADIYLIKGRISKEYYPDEDRYYTRTSADGSFRFPSPSREYPLTSGVYTLQVQHDEHAPLLRLIELDADSKQLLHVRLEDGFSLSGTVVTRYGEPAAGELLMLECLEQGLFRAGGVVADDGSYKIPHLPPGTYEVELGNTLAREVSYLLIDKDARADFVVGGSAITGFVRQHEASCRHSLLHVWSQQQSFLWRGMRVRSAVDDDGGFYVDYLSPGTYTLGIDRAAINAPEEPIVRDIVVNDEDVHVELNTDVDWVRGTITTSTGKPAVFADLTLVHQPPSDRTEALIRMFHAYQARFWTGSDGRFGIDRVPPGSHYIVVSKAGYATRALPVNKKTGKDITSINAVLKSPVVVAVKVTSQSDEVPEALWMAVADSEGRLLFQDWLSLDETASRGIITCLGPGQYELFVHPRNHAILRKRLVIVRGAVNHVRLDLEKGHTVDVTVRDQSGEPVPLTDVVLDTRDHVSLAAALIERRGVRITDRHGKVTHTHVADGKYTVRALAEGYEPAAANIEVNGRDQEATVVLKPAGAQHNE